MIFLICGIIAFLAAGGYFFIEKAFDFIIASQLDAIEWDDSALPPQEDEAAAPHEPKDGKPLAVSEKFSAAGSKPGFSENTVDGEAGQSFPQNPASAADSTSKSPSYVKNGSAPSAEGAPQYTYVQIKEMERKVTIADKAKAVNIVLSKLTPKDIAMLRAMAEGGITASEMSRAKKLIKSRITEKEKKELKELYNKYIQSIKGSK